MHHCELDALIKSCLKGSKKDSEAEIRLVDNVGCARQTANLESNQMDDPGCKCLPAFRVD